MIPKLTLFALAHVWAYAIFITHIYVQLSFTEWILFFLSDLCISTHIYIFINTHVFYIYTYIYIHIYIHVHIRIYKHIHAHTHAANPLLHIPFQYVHLLYCIAVPFRWQVSQSRPCHLHLYAQFGNHWGHSPHILLTAFGQVTGLGYFTLVS